MRQTLVIDDDTPIMLRRTLVAEVLEAPGHRVIAVANRFRRDEVLAQFPELIPANVVVSRAAVFW